MRAGARREPLPLFAELDAEYEILREIGRGGTAVVYLARERELGRNVAVKVVRATYIEDAEAAARLEREARMIGGLQHPNIVMLYATRRLRDRSLALIMQYVDGRTLKSEIRTRGPLPFEDVRRILREMGAALAYAHRHRIVHRDIKPENIYLDDETGIARLSDFGTARPWDAGSSVTLPGSVIGTPTYMSPEQIDGAPLDGRSDLYSLALVGWEMISGTQPWQGETLFGTIYKQKHERLPALDRLRADVPPGLQRAIEGALDKHPAGRWEDAEAFLRALQDESGVAIGSPAARSDTADREPERPHRAAASPDTPTILFRPGEVAAATASSAAALPVEASAAAAAAGAAEGDDDAVTYGGVIRSPTSGRPRRGVVAAVLALLLIAAAATFGLARRQAAEIATAPAAPADPAGSAVAAAGGFVPGGEHREIARDGDPPTGVAADDEAAPDDGAADDDLAVPGEAAAPAGPAQLRVAGGSDVVQAGPGASVPVAVAVLDSTGRPVPDVPVRFEVERGGGEIGRADVRTGPDGTARTEWTLGTTGEQAARASIAGANVAAAGFRARVVPPPLRVRSTLAPGGTHTCWLDDRGQVACWGGNDAGQLGDGSGTRTSAPVAVGAREAFATITAGVSHTCALGVSGSAFCWGANSAGQLGTGDGAPRLAPAPVSLDARLVSIAAGMGHSCGLSDDGALYCWGSNANGQLGDGSRTDRARPVRASGTRSYRAVVLGWMHTCALGGDGAAYCWGRNSSGELGDGTQQDRARPVRVAGGHSFVALAAGSAHTCGLRRDGSILCWGQNTYGQLGDGSVSGSSVPVQVASAGPFGSLTAGSVHTCALGRDGSAHCWGRNTHGQLGDGTNEDRPRATPVAGDYRFTSLHASGAHTCGSRVDGTWMCWGYNLEGQLGDGSRTSRARPVPVTRSR